MKCLILAGGYGTRLWPITRDKAKALLDINGKPIISHILEKIPSHIEIVVSTNKKFASDFSQWQSTIKKKVELFIEDSTNNTEKLGAIGSINSVVQNKGIKEDLLLIASDNYFEFNLQEFISSFDGENTLVAIHDIHDINKAKQFGVVSLSGNKIIEFSEKPQQPHSSLIATACYIISAKALQHLPEYCIDNKDNLGSFISYLLIREPVKAFVFTENWIDIGTIESYNEAISKYG